ncbi:tetratricopeptide repeat protein [Kordia sp.]|uniref:tetratricopeptide repeat protein n=1 Tax=Kordia sp. TaxID=1965332 RepID=UPI003D273AF7
MSQEYIFTLLFSLLAFRMLVIVFHEFGHAVAALFHSDEKVSVYIGSYGNPEKSFHFQIKRLECFIKYNIFTWKGGLCIPHGKNISWKGNMYISLFGPLTTLTIGVLAGTSLLLFEKFSLSTMLIFAVAFSTILDFIFNIIPRKTQIKLHNGTFANNDGKQLMHLWNIRNVFDTYRKASNHYVAKEYNEAAVLFEKCIAPVAKNREIYKLTIACYLNGKNYIKAIALNETYTEIYHNSFDLYDMVTIGVIEIYKENYTKALELFEEALEISHENHIILNNRGYVLGLLNRHEEAIKDLDKALLINENFAFAWDNRGFSKIMLGQLEEGYTDLQKSLELDDQNSEVYRNIGIYHFKKKDYQTALEFYQKAVKIDAETHKIQAYIAEVTSKL